MWFENHFVLENNYCPHFKAYLYFSNIGDPTSDDNLACGWYPPPESGLTPVQHSDPPDKEIWLFNIAKDPQEKNDVSDLYRGIVKRMLQRLQYYYNTMVPVQFPDLDPNSNPVLHGGVWEPWE